MSSWASLGRDIFLFRDSCNVYAVRGANAAWLIVNAGTGAAAGALEELGEVRELTVLLTHHFRDHTAGAEKFLAKGGFIVAPWHERGHLAGAQPAMRTKPTRLNYDLSWDHFAPIAPVAVNRWLLDYEKISLAGLPVEVVPTPGVTMGASSYVVTLLDGSSVAFVGELMSGPGKLARLSPLQYNYNDLTGVENVLLSWERVLRAEPRRALPSLGEPFEDLLGAVAALRSRAVCFEAIHPGFAARVQASCSSQVQAVLPRLYRATQSSAETHFVVSRTGKILALDFGYDTGAVKFPSRAATWTRRPLLHSWRDLQRVTGATRIDVVIPTHYHDDHVAGIPLLQRLFGTELWAPENFAALLEKPGEFDRPCLWSEQMKPTRRLPLGQSFEWEDISITLHPMSGHTEFSCLVLLEIDGQRVAHTGDQLFFVEPGSGRPVGPTEGRVFTNHVYRNGLAAGCYQEFLGHLREFDPHLIISGHYQPYRPEEGLWRRLDVAAQEFDAVHHSLLGLGDLDVHFGADSTAAKIFPYEIEIADGGGEVRFKGWVKNPFGYRANALLGLVSARPGWQGTNLALLLEAREQACFELVLRVPAEERCVREPVALQLTVGGRPFGQVAEAWVSIRGTHEPDRLHG